MALNIILHHFLPITLRSVSKMAPSIFMTHIKFTGTGNGSSNIATTAQTAAKTPRIGHGIE